MSARDSLAIGLEDLLADMHHAQRAGDLGRLALVAFCDARRWARQAGETDLAELTERLFASSPQHSREAFLAGIEALIAGLERARGRFARDPHPDPLSNPHPPAA
ncbi:MAG: hypothetical protein ACOYLV_02255 [Rubrivivax sp.]|jgi:hypothetical protein